MVYITGDTHGDFERFEAFCDRHKTTSEDIMIILGDAGLNYFGDGRDRPAKDEAARYPITFFCIHGNHERRPATLEGFKTKEFCGGTVWYEEEYPNTLFAKDGEVYRLAGYDCIAIGGAYSVDKYIRLLRGYHWFTDEQPSDEVKAQVEKTLAERKNCIDVVLSHTCPRKYEPKEVFLGNLDQSTVDKSTEDWLDKIEKQTHYIYWYCGHFHTQKKIDRMRFMFQGIAILGE